MSLFICLGAETWIQLPEGLSEEQIYSTGTIEAVFSDTKEVTVKYNDGELKGENKVFIDMVFKMGPKAKTSADTYADMCDMECLNEAELLENLRIRYEDDHFFTYIGPTLLVINPYCLIKKLYTAE